MNAIQHLAQLPETHADRPFMIDAKSGRTVTYAANHQAALRIGKALRDKGLQRGDRVALYMENSIAFAQFYFGCLYAGVVVVPVNPVLARDESVHILKHSDAQFLVIDDRTAGKLPAEVWEVPPRGVLHLAPAADPAEKAIAFSLDDLPPVDPAFDPWAGASPDDWLCIIYTSGTTSTPKGVVHRVRNLVDNARLFNEEVGVTSKNRFYNILAMAYLGGYYNLLLLPYVAGASVVIAPTFSAATALDFWSAAIQHQVNTLWLVPTILSILQRLDRGDKGPAFCREHVRLALVGTAPLPGAVKEDFQAKYGLRLDENYALSETLFLTTCSDNVPSVDGSVGRLLSGVQLTVRGPDGRNAPYGQEGEIYVRTPYLMVGYHETGDAFEPLSPNSWFPTGDIGVFMPTGDLHITGRKKDLIIRGGVNISPASIENVLHEDQAVDEAAVIGAPHEVQGEEIIAVLRLRPGHDLETVRPRLETLCKQKLGAIRLPTRYLEMADMPKSSTGKINKVEVRAAAFLKLGITQEQRKPAAAPQKPAPAATALPGTINRAINRAPADLIKQLSAFPTTIVSDCLNRLGAMDARIQPLVRGRAFCGSAITVEEVEGGNLMGHAALELAERGDVIVIDAKQITSRSCWGGLQTRMASLRGVAALVIDGAIRDYDDVEASGMPVYCLGCVPTGPLKGWSGHVNTPISCGGVVVNPGDIVIGDNDGVVSVPAHLAAAIVPLCQARLDMEAQWLKQIEAGTPTLDVVGLRQRLSDFNITIH